MANVELVTGRTGAYNATSDLKDVYVPHTIYFYYVTSRTGTTGTEYDEAILYVLEKSNPIPVNTLDTEIIALTRKARNGHPTHPERSGKGFGRDPWRRRSYLVVVLDDDAGDNRFKPGNAVEIARKKGSRRHKNHCFFNGGEGEIDVDGKPIGYLWTVNYMKAKAGKDVPAGKHHVFSFKFNPTKRRLHDGDEEDHGTNMGPPIGPP